MRFLLIPLAVFAAVVTLIGVALKHDHSGQTCVYVGDQKAHCGSDFTIVIQPRGDGVTSWTVTPNKPAHEGR
jgi:hypothetical protein